MKWGGFSRTWMRILVLAVVAFVVMAGSARASTDGEPAPVPSLKMVGTNAEVTNPEHPQYLGGEPSSPPMTITTAQDPPSIMDEHIAVEKTFEELEPIWMVWVRGPRAPDVITLEETVINGTGVAWTDFHLSLSGGATFYEDQEPTLEPEPIFSVLSPDYTAADLYYSPSILSGEDLVFGVINGIPDPTDVRIDISQVPVGGSFMITQYPTVIPEPATFLLLGLPGGWLVRRRMRR